MGGCLIFNFGALCKEVDRAAGIRSSHHDFVSYRDRIEPWETPFQLSAECVATVGARLAVEEHFARFLQSLLFEKALDWSSELEYRFLVQMPTSDRFAVPIGPAIEGVILGEQFDGKTASVKELLAPYGLSSALRVRWLNGYPVVSAA